MKKNKKSARTSLSTIQKYNKKFKKFCEIEMRNYEERKRKYEDTSLTKFLFHRYLLLRNFKAILSISLIFLGYFAYRFEFDQTISEEDGAYLYVLVSLFTLLLIVLQVLEIRILKQRNQAKKKLREVHLYEPINYLVLVSISIIHPNHLFFRKKLIDEKTYNGSSETFVFRRNFNEFLYIFQLTWLYFQFLKTFLVNSIWYSDQSDRISRMIGFRLSDLYVIKCLIRDQKKVTCIIALLGSLFYYMIALTVVEGPLFYMEDIGQGYKNFIYPSVSLWFTVVTLPSIGFGDQYVVTDFGRIFVSFLGIFGNILLTFVTVAIIFDFSFGE